VRGTRFHINRSRTEATETRRTFWGVQGTGREQLLERRGEHNGNTQFMLLLGVAAGFDHIKQELFRFELHR